MKFIINSTHLLKALDRVQGVVDKRNITPILNNIRIAVEDSRLILNATDMDLDIVEILEADILLAGSTTVSAHMMLETVKRLPSNSSIDFTCENDQLTIKCGRFKSNLHCLPVEDFPIIQSNDLPTRFNVARLDLKKLIEKTRFAISLDETRYYLNGIYLHTTENVSGEQVLRAVATDGHRLALVDCSAPSGASMPDGIILPKKAVDEIYKLVDKLEDETLELACSTTRISFKFKNVIFTSKLIDGQFPNYNRVIPSGNDKILEVNRTDFINAVDLISTYSDEKLKAIKIEIMGQKIKLVAHRTDGLGEQELDIVHNIEEMQICFNSKYINDICSLIKTESLVMYLSSPTTPALIKQSEVSDELFVIMPMRI